MNLKDIPDYSTPLDIKDMLDQSPYESRHNILQICMKKIPTGEKLTLRGIDCFTLTNNFIYGYLSEEALNKEVYSRKSMSDVSKICKELTDGGFTIVEKQIHLGPNRSNFILEAVRNG